MRCCTLFYKIWIMIIWTWLVYRLKECEQTNEIQGIIYEFHEIKWWSKVSIRVVYLFIYIFTYLLKSRLNFSWWQQLLCTLSTVMLGYESLFIMHCLTFWCVNPTSSVWPMRYKRPSFAYEMLLVWFYFGICRIF